ncbi:OmpA family protein, partial [Pseudomonas syringae]|uniref:OmpA family protein n=1 Tax=Pseudomonas syringae TaxID=317 RepID=UPI0011B0EBCA
ELDAAAKARLDNMVVYLKADPTVNHVELDGHSDNSGNRLTNRDLSRRRALAVMDYLKAQCIPEQQITLRFHGERYPLAPNTNNANRARKRRVNVHLERVAPEERPVPVASASAAHTS